MKIIPTSVLNVINNKDETTEEVIYENKYFIVLKDIDHIDETYHYTAWIKKDVRSVVEINFEIIEQIKSISIYLLKKNIIQKNHLCFIHFPPNYWRLHIHFTQDNYELRALRHEVLFFNDVICKYNDDPDYFIKNVNIL